MPNSVYLSVLLIGLLTLYPDQHIYGFEYETASPAGERLCKEPPPPRNGSVTVWGNGMLIEYRCDPGLFPLGETFGSCNPISGRWSIRRPYCVSSKCKTPRTVFHGTIYFTNNGSVMTSTCEPGYKLIGTRRRYCNGYSWSGIPPSCLAKFPAGDDKREASEHVNTTDPDVIFQRQLEIDVEDSDDTCYRRFSPPPEIENGQPIVEYKYNKLKRQWIAIANYTCNDGFRLEDKYQRYKYCKGYNWIGKQSPKCVPDKVPEEPCKEQNGGCQHICVPYNDGRYYCDCFDGYTRATNPRKCSDVDECSLDNGGCEQTCNNLVGSYFCSCDMGYIASGQSCHDVDECSDTERHSCPGDCINLPGTFACNCTIPGFKPSNDKQICTEIDECKQNNGGCEDACINLYGSYKCRCFKKGYRLSADGKSCEDVNECKKYGKRRCRNGECVNIPGSYQCTCNDGFNESKNRRKCIDKDECRTINGDCEHVCINVPGNYSCSCDEGYQLNMDGISCSDIDECSTDNGGCDRTCENTVGSYKCLCPGHLLVLSEDGHNCTYCNQSHYYSSFKSRCIPCRDFSSVPDHINGTSSDDCKCNTGFKYVEVTDTCEDNDECTTGDVICDQMCHNTIGSAFCGCFDGYEQYDGQCVDINECETNLSLCSQNCNNTDGSYRCFCDDGFEISNDNFTCEDIDECYSGVMQCDHTCTDYPGGANCECLSGFKLQEDNITCLDIDECATNNVCADVCINTNGSFDCDCAGDGLKLSWDKASCSDINECMEGENTCEDECVNTVGSYRCSCSRTGFQLKSDNTSCEDIDECGDKNGHRCDHLCINEIGSYRCDCNPGYSLASFHTCAPCPRDYYRSANSSECTACPALSITTGIARTSIADCTCIPGYTGNLAAGELCHKQ